MRMTALMSPMTSVLVWTANAAVMSLLNCTRRSAILTRTSRADLDSGKWDRRHGHLREQDVYDGGYPLAVAAAG